MESVVSYTRRICSAFIVIIDRITEGMAIVSGVLLFALAPMITVAVLLRYYFKVSVAWSTEIEEYFLYLGVLLASAWVLRNDEHVRVDVVVNLMNPRLKRVMNLLSNFLGAITSVGLFYYGLLATYENYVKGTLTIKVMPIPKYLPFLFVPIMAAMVFFQFLRKVIYYWRLSPDGEEKKKSRA